MKLVSRGFALAVIVTVVVGCAAGKSDPLSPGTAGQTAGTGVAGSSGAGTVGSAGAMGTAGSGACATPPVVKTAWTIGRDASGAQISCAQAGASSVQLFMDKAHTMFSCDSAAGMSTDFPAGSYTPRVLLAGSQGTILSQGNLNPVTVPSCGVLDLGSLRFVVAPTGAAGGGGTAGAGGSSGAAGGGGTAGSSGTAGMPGTGPCNAMPIFAVHSCGSPMACHDANGAGASFNMTSTGWEKNLVGNMPKAGGAPGLGSACIAGAMPYLVAGSVPARGLFLDKLNPNKPAPCGARMPLIPPDLSAAEFDCVQRWANGLTKP